MYYSILPFHAGMFVLLHRQLIKIAIVGGGPAGVSLCLQLTQALNALKSKAKISIILFEKSTDIGFGLPYASPEEAFCVNLSKEYMALKPEEYHHFSAWLTQKYNMESTMFPPRHYFGQYARERLFNIQNAQELEIVRCTEHEVFDILAVNHNQYQIHTWHKNNKVNYRVNYVILATGHIPSTVYSHLRHFPECQSNPWNMLAYQNLSSHYHVGIIGTRLTAIDVALKLNQQKHQGKITMISRLGLLSSVRGTHPVPNIRYLTPKNIQNLLHYCNSLTLLPSLMSLFEQEIAPYLPQGLDFWSTVHLIKTMNPAQRICYEIRQAELHNTAWQSVLSCFYQIIFRLWPQLHPTQQSHFLESQTSLMLTFLCSFPLDKAYIIQSMMHTQQLSIHSGLMDIKKTAHHFSLQLEQGKSIQCDYLILAVGSGNNPENQSLFANMLKRGLIIKHALGGLCIDSNTYRICTEHQIEPPQIFALGELVSGVCFKMIEVGQVVEQARVITNQIVEQLTLGVIL
jgi:uncharacterized NAD(P)/FAD-binding protein YdhS